MIKDVGVKVIRENLTKEKKHTYLFFMSPVDLHTTSMTLFKCTTS